MNASEIIRAAQREVDIFENSLRHVLEPCTSEEVARVIKIGSPTIFSASVYALVRRVEAAAAMHPNESNPHVLVACIAVEHLVPSIQTMRQRVVDLPANTELEEAGKEFLIERLDWALWILTERLHGWGY